MRVLYETMKCEICGCLSGQPVKCKDCHAIYCKQCPYTHKNDRLACFSDFEPACIRCLQTFPASIKDGFYDKSIKKPGMNMLEEADHFRLNSELKTKLKDKYGQITDEDMK